MQLISIDSGGAQRDRTSPTTVSVLILLSPVVFICHFLEESPGFVDWFNSHVAPGITSDLFWTVNIYGLLITVAVAAFEWTSRSPFSLSLALAWLSFLMLANAVFHLTAAFVDGRYVPGLGTAILLYLPFYGWLFWKTIKTHRINTVVLTAVTLAGAVPMFIHGYFILFRGTRLV